MIAVLKARLRNGTAMDTSYIFAGGSGTGKTTTARIFARAMLCPNRNPETQEPCNECENCSAILSDTSLIFTEKDAASQGTIDHVRKIVDDLAFATFGGEKRIYLLDEAHAISKASQDLLLKSIEEKRLVVFFCTTEPEKIRGAIRSRCEEHYVRKSTRDDLFSLAKEILAKERVSPVEDEAIYTVVDTTGGHVRDAINKLEMVAQLGEGVTVTQVDSVLNLSTINAYYKVLDLLPRDLGQALSLVGEVSQRVSADEAYAGIAEAAMNSFRMSCGLLCEFTYVDRDLATSISQTYGEYLVKIASVLSQARYLTYTTLIADLVLLSRDFRGTPILPPSRPVTAIPEVGQVGTSPTAPTPVTAPHVPAPQPTLIQPADRTVPSPRTVSGLREDGVGNLGSADPLALTAYDTFVVPDAPTGKRDNHKGSLAVQVKPVLHGREVLTSEAWRAQFEEMLSAIRGTK